MRQGKVKVAWAGSKDNTCNRGGKGQVPQESFFKKFNLKNWL